MRSDQVTKVMMFLLYTYIKQQKHFRISDKLNNFIKLIRCDGTLQLIANNVVPNFDDITLCKHVTAEEENAFIVFNSFSLIRKK